MTRVPLNRALSKLGALSRARATEAIREGRVSVGGRVVRDPLHGVIPERAKLLLDGKPVERSAWRTLLFYKPAGVVTTRRDPEGRKTVFDVIGDEARGLQAVGRLDLATSGLLLLTTDTQLANWIADPASGVSRVYVVTAKGLVADEDVARLTSGVTAGRDALRAHAVSLRKSSGRESHLIVELREGKNREVRRLFEAIGHEVTRLKRVTLGILELGELKPGEWRELSREEIRSAFPDYTRRSTQRPQRMQRQ